MAIDHRNSAPRGDAVARAALDLELVHRAQSLDQVALGSLFSNYYPRIFNYCLSSLRDVPTAEDVAAEVMLKMVESIYRYRPSGAPFSTWVFRIARNKLIDRHRRGKQRRRVPLTEGLVTSGAGPDLLVERAQTHTQLYRALRELAAAERDVISLRFIAGLNTRTVALLIGRTESAVKSLQHRGLKSLRRRLALSQLESSVIRDPLRPAPVLPRQAGNRSPGTS